MPTVRLKNLGTYFKKKKIRVSYQMSMLMLSLTRRTWLPMDIEICGLGIQEALHLDSPPPPSICPLSYFLTVHDLNL